MTTYRVGLRDRPTFVVDANTFDYDDASRAYWFADGNGVIAVLPSSEVLAISADPPPVINAVAPGEVDDEDELDPCECDGCTQGLGPLVTVLINGTPIAISAQCATYLLNEFMTGAIR